MKTKTLKVNNNQSNGKIPYENPMLKGIDQTFGLVVMGDSSIIDDENHEYSPDND